MEIIMARGDLEQKTILLKTKAGQTYTTEPDEIYFTVKKYADDHDYLFQKRLTDGGILYVETGKYTFNIEPEDTNGLSFGEYAMDIEIVKEGVIKKTFLGKLTLAREVTHYYNEVVLNG